VAGVSQAMGDCVDTLPALVESCSSYTCEALAAGNNCNVAWNTCAPSASSEAVSSYCQKSCGICTPVVVAPVPVCAGSPYSKEACEQVAANLGLQKGGAGSAFVGNWAGSPRGCYAYKTGKYANMVFYNNCDKGWFSDLVEWVLDDSCKKQMQEIPTDGNQYRPNGYDCSVGCHPYSLDACKAAAAAQGLSEGGAGSAFVGKYWDKGCYAYSSGGYKGMAFYSTGGDNSEMSKLPGKRDNWYRPAGHDCN